MKNDKAIWFLFDFDDVITSGYSKGNKYIHTFIDILTIRKEENITFQESCYRFGLRPTDIVKKYAEASPPNLKLIPKLKRIIDLKRIGKQYQCGIASNNSDYLISKWLKIYKLQNSFDILLTPEIFGWIRKPDREFFSECINILNVNPEQIVFYDDNSENVDIANKMGINSYLYHRYDHFQEVEQYVKE